MYQQDYVMRQIETAVRFIAKLMFGSESLTETFLAMNLDLSTDYLLPDLLKLVERGEYAQAEDRLFDHITSKNADYLAVALTFYDKLNSLSDRELESGRFSREEVREGLRDVAKEYGIELGILLE